MKPLLVVIALGLALPSPARADPAADRKQAQALYNEGTDLYVKKDYAGAIQKFREAYALLPQPLFLYNIAQAFKQSNDCVAATEYYQKYLVAAPTDPDRPKIEAWITELEPCVKAASAKPIVMPGEVVDDLPENEPRKPMRLAGILTTTGGVVLLGVGGFFSFRARAAAGDIEEACKVSCNAAQVAEIDDRGASAERNATILYIAGGAVTALGLGFLVYSVVAGKDERIAIVPTQGGAMAAAGWSF